MRYKVLKLIEKGLQKPSVEDTYFILKRGDLGLEIEIDLIEFEEIGSLLGYHKSTITQALSILKKLGYISIINKTRKPHKRHERKRKKYLKYVVGSREYFKAAHIKSKYKLSLEDFEVLKAISNNKCEICGISEEQLPKGLCVDHCHITNKIRGLLCTSCNIGLGVFKDSPENLKNAIGYLNKEY